MDEIATVRMVASQPHDQILKKESATNEYFYCETVRMSRVQVDSGLPPNAVQSLFSK
jgi:hypothetical protein